LLPFAVSDRQCIVTRRNRRRLLLVIAAAALAGDACLFAFHVSEEARLRSAPLFADLETLVIERPLKERMPVLSGSEWRLEQRVIPDFPRYVHALAAQQDNLTEDGPLTFISLGSDLSYGHFLRSLATLKEHRLCHVLVREAGTEWPDMDMVEIPMLKLCGKSISAMLVKE
jgi:hypothetical protein